MVEAMRRYQHAKTVWEGAREAWRQDARMAWVVGGQWDKTIADRRDAAGKPVLEFNEEHTYISQVVNRARQDRPQPKVTPGDDLANQDTADFIEGRLRHIQYASQADVAYDCAVEGSGTGGFGFYRVDKEYVDRGSRGGRPSRNMEPRIKRILDPMTQLPDPSCQEPDFSDAQYWFDRGWMGRDKFRREFKAEPVPFDSDCDPEWAKEDEVCVARYWTVTETPRRYLWLTDGREGYADELDQVTEDLIEAERDDPERTVECHIIDGEKKLKTIPWEGDWIPYIPVLGGEKVIDGKKLYIGVVRYAHGAQNLKNAYKSGIANLLQLASTAPWTGPRGMFRSKKWEEANEQNFATLEWDLVYDKNGQLVNASPQRNTFEAPIQALAASAIAASDDIKRAVGYTDAVLQPSKADLSGIAVLRRSEQQNLTNWHYEDNLVRSQFHCARVVLDLDMKLADTPRALKARKEDGKTWTMPVTMAGDDGQIRQVPGYEGKPHVRFDIGRYDLTIQTGPGYDSKIKEESDVLLEILKTNPAFWPIFADVIFKLLGYRDLEERAKLTLPPQIQMSMQADGKGMPPQAIGIITALQNRAQQMQMVLQKVLTMLQTKQIEAKGKLDLEKVKLIRELLVEQSKQRGDMLQLAVDHRHDTLQLAAEHRHDSAKHLLSERTDAVEHLMQMLHESELAPDPNAIAQPGAAPAAGGQPG